MTENKEFFIEDRQFTKDDIAFKVIPPNKKTYLILILSR
jgi:hypothetical protein